MKYLDQTASINDKLATFWKMGLIAKSVAESRTKSMENNTTKTLLMDFVSVPDVLFILWCLERLINSNMPCFNVFYV